MYLYVHMCTCARGSQEKKNVGYLRIVVIHFKLLGYVRNVVAKYCVTVFCVPIIKYQRALYKEEVNLTYSCKYLGILY